MITHPPFAMGYYKIWTTILTSAFALAAQGSNPQQLPPQSVYIEPSSFAVIGPNGPFIDDSFTQFLNPTKTKPPFFQMFHQDFLQILGHSPSFHQIVYNATLSAREAPIYVPETDEVYFSSSVGGPSSAIWKISMAAVEAALKAVAAEGSNTTVNVPVTRIDLPDSIRIINGGTGPYHSSLLVATLGNGSQPPLIALVNPEPPNNVTVLLDNYYGRQYNSLNDIKVHPSGNIYFVDVDYGHLNNLRPEPLMPNQVYSFDPISRSVRVVATDFNKCNGIAFTEDGRLAYVTDTAAVGGNFGNNYTLPATIYTFDVDPESLIFSNRRVLAYADSGIPDGISLDKNGNVYSSCGDGVHVWNPQGVLLGKLYLGRKTSNFIFAGKGRMVILAEEKIFFARIAAQGSRVEFP